VRYSCRWECTSLSLWWSEQARHNHERASCARWLMSRNKLVGSGAGIHTRTRAVGVKKAYLQRSFSLVQINPQSFVNGKQVGSGKSSLLAALRGELRLVHGHMYSAGDIDASHGVCKHV